MIDTEALKARFDLRNLVERDLGDPVSRGRDAWTWKCPFHQEVKGAALAVWSDGWHCFGACAEGGDAISWLMKRHEVSFMEAVLMLDTESPPQSLRKPTPASVVQPSGGCAAPPVARWQTAALRIVEEAEQTLWSPAGERALAYLTGRGLLRSTIREARLGYVPGHSQEWRTCHDLKVPCGITIPWFAAGNLWGVKVRRATGSVRYVQIAGGAIAGGLYWADNLRPGWTALLVEGEFNCLIAWQEAMDVVCPISLGSASTRLDARWYSALVVCPQILVCCDTDEAGIKASDRLQALTARAKLIRVPQGKDINDLYLSRIDKLDGVRPWLVQMTMAGRSNQYDYRCLLQPSCHTFHADM